MGGLLPYGYPASVERVELPNPAEDGGGWRRRALRWLQLPSAAGEVEAETPSVVQRRRMCGRLPQFGAEAVDLMATVPAEGERVRARWSGVARCDSWACPVCSQGKAMEAAVEVCAAMDVLKRAGAAGYLVTMTLGHSAGEALESVLSDLLSAWGSVSGGRWWGSVLPEGSKKVAVVKALETTHGRNGWHPHLHLLLILSEPLSAVWTCYRRDPESRMMGRAVMEELASVRRRREELRDADSTLARNLELRGLRERELELERDLGSFGWASDESMLAGAIRERWSRAVARKGREAGAEAVKFERVTNPARYLMKAGLEVAGGSLKRGRRGNATPWDLLHTAATAPIGAERVEALGLYREWEAAMHGRHPITGLGRALDLLWVSEADLVAARLQLDPQPLERLVARVPAALWLALVARGLDLDLLELIEAGDEARALAALSAALSSQWGRVRPDRAAAAAAAVLQAPAGALELEKLSV